jgi:PIN domain
MKLRVYLETSVISYLTSRPALDVITAGHQATTFKWWEGQRSNYELFVSQFVIDEASIGDPIAAASRMASLAGIPRLNVQRPEIALIARALLAQRALPQKAFVDALHIAVSAVSGVDILLTWNFKHIANGAMMKHIERVCVENGYGCPKLLTPLQLLGDDDVD